MTRRIFMSATLNLVCSAAFLSAVLSGCSEKKDVAGGTEAESTIALQVQMADGSPAAFTRVRALPVGYLPDGLTEAEWTETDENGYVALPKDPGVYTVEARNVNDSLATGAVFVKNLERSETLVSDTLSLGNLSKIEGYVAAGQGPSVVRIAGLERFITPDSSGHFVIDSLPPGNFEIFIESRSNRGSVTLQASAGEAVPEVSLGQARGFAVENFESFSGISATGKILGDGWWYTLDVGGKNLMPLWDESLTKTYSGSDGCASGGCARTTNRLGFLLGGYKTSYELPDLDTLMFSARGNGTLRVALAYGGVSEGDSVESGFEYEVSLSKVWQGYAISVADMAPYGDAVPKKGKATKIIVSRIDFGVQKGDTVFLDDVFLGGIDEESLGKVATDLDVDTTAYPADWNDHKALLAEIAGYAEGTLGAAGVTDSSGEITKAEGEICEVTTTDDFVIVEDTTKIDSAGSFETTAVVAPGSLRECASKDGPVWILFKHSGTYNLQSPLRLKTDKTIDGRGRDVRITGMGVLTNESSNIIFENLTFTKPAITVLDTSSRRALSIHNKSHHIWVDHCTFEEYPLVELDIKRGSHHVTVSWSRFENAQTGILFGLEPLLFDERGQVFTMHHNYFANMGHSAAFARSGRIHAYNNFFMDLAHYGIECTDSANCYIERNVFNIDSPVSLYRLFADDGPVDSTVGFVNMVENWYAVEANELAGDARGYEPDYKYDADRADADLAWKVKEHSGPR